MIDLGTRLRISEIATTLWRMLRARPLFFAGTQDFNLTEHSLDNNHADTAVVELGLDSDAVGVAIGIRDIAVSLSVIAPGKLSIRTSYRIGSTAVGDTAVISRKQTETVELQDQVTTAVAQLALDQLLALLRPDLEVLLAPHKAFITERKG